MHLTKPDWLIILLDEANWTLELPPWELSFFDWVISGKGSWGKWEINPGHRIEHMLHWLLAKLNEYGTAIEDEILKAWEKAQAAFALAQEVAAKVLRDIAQAATSVFQTLTDYISTIYRDIEARVHSVYDVLVRYIQDVALDLEAVIESSAARVLQVALSYIAPLQAFYNQFHVQVEAFFNDPKNYIMTRLEELFEEQKERVEQMFGRFIEAIW